MPFTKNRKRAAGLIVVIVSLACPLIMLLGGGENSQTGFPLDDAWIHLVYGRSVSESGYLAYNSGTPAAGETSPLWGYLLGIIHILTQDTAMVIWLIKALGIVLLATAALGTLFVIESLCQSVLAGLIGGILIGASPVLAAASISGMEIVLAASLAIWGLAFYLRRKNLPAGILMGLAALSRPEFGIVILVLLGNACFRLIKKDDSLRSLVRFAAPVTVAAALFAGWNLAVDGRPFPATFYQKAALGGEFGLKVRVLAGLGMISKEPPFIGGMAWLGLLGLFFASKSARRGSVLLLSAGVLYLLSQVAVIVPLDPRAFYYIRYLLPAFPLVFAPLVSGWASGIRFVLRPGQADSTSVRRTIAAVFMIMALFPSVFGMIIGIDEWRMKFANDCRNINEVQVELGKAVDRAFARDARIGTVDAGAVKYFGRRYTIDLMGLNTPDVRNGSAIVRPLDALIIIPAWVVFPGERPLPIIGIRSTRNYQVTYQSQMNTQVIAAAECGVSLLIVRAIIVSKPMDIPLNCAPSEEIMRLKKKLAPQGR
jgi:hypothetical protein